MPWAKIDDGYLGNQKIRGLPSAAKWLDIAGIIWCAHNLTDGQIEAVQLSAIDPALRNPRKWADELVKVGRWYKTVSGWAIHDYLRYNPRREDVETRRAEDLARKRGDSDTDSVQIPRGIDAESKRNRDRLVPSRTRNPNPKNQDQKLFERFWAVFPRRTGKRVAFAAFVHALKRAPAEDILAGAERYRDDPNRDPGYTKTPAPWLNGDGWLDDPIPARSNGKPDRAMEIASGAWREGVDLGTDTGRADRGEARRSLPGS